MLEQTEATAMRLGGEPVTSEAAECRAAPAVISEQPKHGLGTAGSWRKRSPLQRAPTVSLGTRTSTDEH